MTKRLKHSLAIMVSFVLLLTMFSTVSASETTTSQTIDERILEGSMTVDGRERVFKYYVPTSFGKNQKEVPLMISFHGRGSNMDGQIRLSSFHHLAEKEGFIVVFPESTYNTNGLTPAEIAQGYAKQWNDGRDNPANRAGVDDVKFTSELIDYFADNYHVDLSRVYASGMSNGSRMANRLAVELSDRIAGIGGVVGPLNEAVAEKTPKGPVPVVLFAGTNDPVVNYNGLEGDYLSAEATVDYWVKHNRTVKKPRVTVLPQTGEENPGHSTKVIRYVYSGGKQGSEVVFYKMDQAGHVWPGGPQYYGPELIGHITNHINGTQVIWDELKTHSIPGAKASYK